MASSPTQPAQILLAIHHRCKGAAQLPFTKQRHPAAWVLGLLTHGHIPPCMIQLDSLSVQLLSICFWLPVQKHAVALGDAGLQAQYQALAWLQGDMHLCRHRAVHHCRCYESLAWSRHTYPFDHAQKLTTNCKGSTGCCQLTSATLHYSCV